MPAEPRGGHGDCIRGSRGDRPRFGHRGGSKRGGSGDRDDRGDSRSGRKLLRQPRHACGHENDPQREHEDQVPWGEPVADRVRRAGGRQRSRRYRKRETRERSERWSSARQRERAERSERREAAEQHAVSPGRAAERTQRRSNLQQLSVSI